MKVTRRILSWVLAVSLVISCGIMGLVLPTSAEAPADLLNGQGSFEEGTTPNATILSDMFAKTDGSVSIVDNPSGEGKVVRLGVEDTFKHASYPKWKKLYNAETDKYDKYLSAGKTYTLSFDVYGNGVGFYFQGDFHVLSHNADENTGGANGWFQLGSNDFAEEWKTYTFTFYADADIAETYHADWWSWGTNFVKGGNNYCPTTGFTYIDNMTVVETQATEIALDVEEVVLEIGDKTEAPVVTATPSFSQYADVVYTTNKDTVATVDAATGVITAVGYGEATITATAGELTDTIKVVVQKDKTQEWADLSKAYYTAGDNKNQPAVLNTDAATGLQYFSVNGSASVRTGNFSKANRGEWLGYTFLIRVTDGANNAGAVRGAVQLQGNVTDGYSQPEFYARTTAMQGDWERVTFYARVRSDNVDPYLVFITLSNGSTSATISYDVADLSIFRPEAGDVNLFGAGADFEDGYAPVAMGSNSQTGLLTKADAAIVNDPTGADNKCFYISKTGANSGAGDYWYAADQTNYSEESNARYQTVFNSSKMYRVRFRVYSASSVTIDSYGGASFKGTSGTAAKSGEWRTVTTYMYTDSSYNAAYALHVRFYGEAYIDDLELYEVTDATGFEIKGNPEMTIGESQMLEVVPTPKHAYPGTLTWSVEGAGMSLSGTTLKASYVIGTTVTGGTVTVTSDLLDADENPITGTFTVKANYPKEIFVNGTMDTGDDTGMQFSSGGPGTSWDYVDGKGVNGSRGVVFKTASAKYMQGPTKYFRPNSVYRFSALARCDVDGVADLELNYVTGDTKDVKVYGIGQHNNISSDWTYYYYYLVTGDAPQNTNSAYHFYFHVRALGTDSAPIYVDNISCELIESGDNMFPDSTFEFNNYLLDSRNLGGSNSFPTFGYANDPSDESNRVLAINNSAGTSYDVMSGFAYLDPYAMYELTFDSKVNEAWKTDNSSMNFYIGLDTVSGGVVTVERKGDTEFFETGAVKQTTEWQSNKVVIFTNSKARISSNTFHFNVSKGSASGNGYLYLDNIQLRRVDKGNSLHATDDNAYMTYVSVDGSKWSSYIADVPAGTVVYARTWGNAADKSLVLRSVTARGADGTFSILNKDVLNGYTADNFGKEGAADRTFQFVMPEGGLQIKTSVKSKTASQSDNYYLNTVGTSLRYTGEKTYDGIRFLTRLSFAGGVFNAEDPDNFTLTKGGETYKVVEIGSLLKRYSETTTGEGEEAVTTEDELTLDNVKWTSVAYKAGENMKLLDYTNYYVDFASVMMKGENLDQDVFEARKYTARGYIVLEDAEGVQTTILAETQQSDSVDSVQARLPQ